MCGCGRSPREDGKCLGFHKYTEEEWNRNKEILLEPYFRKVNEPEQETE